MYTRELKLGRNFRKRSIMVNPKPTKSRTVLEGTDYRALSTL